MNLDHIEKMNSEELAKVWAQTKGYLDMTKKAEIKIREMMVKRFFNDTSPGTRRSPVTEERCVRAVFKQTYKCDNDIAGISKACAAIGPAAGHLINWKPELSLTDYKRLSDDQKRHIDPYITIKDSLPTIAIEKVK